MAVVTGAISEKPDVFNSRKGYPVGMVASIAAEQKQAREILMYFINICKRKRFASK